MTRANASSCIRAGSYSWHAGPFKDVIDAHDYLAAMLARGEIAEADADAATIVDNNIFLQDRTA